MNKKEINDALIPIGNGCYSTFNTLLNSYESAVSCIEKNIEGAFVECGVAAGAQIAAMQLACQHNNQQRIIYAFDSFQGIPLAGKDDAEQPGIGLVPQQQKEETDTRKLLVSSGITAHSLANVIENMKKWEINDANFRYIVGWFQDTLHLKSEEIEKIAILRLDGDLYESTVVCLQYLFPKLVSGGILIIDDWALAGCKKACDEYFKDYIQLGEINTIEGSTPVWFVKK